MSWLLLAASAASLVRLAAQPESGKMALQAQQPDLTWKGGLPWEVISLLQSAASAAGLTAQQALSTKALWMHRQCCFR